MINTFFYLISDCPETFSVDKAGLILTEIHLPLLLIARIRGVGHHSGSKFLKMLR